MIAPDPWGIVAAVADLRAAVAEIDGRLAALASRDDDRWLSTPAAATHLGLSPAALRMRIGRDPSLARLGHGEGRARRWRRSDLDAWLSAPRTGRLRSIGGGR